MLAPAPQMCFHMMFVSDACEDRQEFCWAAAEFCCSVPLAALLASPLIRPEKHCSDLDHHFSNEAAMHLLHRIPRLMLDLMGFSC